MKPRKSHLCRERPLPPPEAPKKNVPSSVPKMADDDDSQQSYASTEDEVVEVAVAQKAVQSSQKEAGRDTSNMPSVTTPSVTMPSFQSFSFHLPV